MDLVLGANGHVGSAVAQRLLAQGRAVTVALRTPAHAQAWEQRGARTAVVDVCNTQALTTVLAQVSRAFVLNPPAPPNVDTDKAERASARAIVAALRQVRLEKIVVQSTYGAQPGEHCADLGVLYTLEQDVQNLPTPCCIVRAAYYMSNWLPQAAAARTNGVLQSLIPADLAVPMVAPQDVGHFAANLLCAPTTDTGLYAIEGPATYTPAQVGACFARLFNRPIRVEAIPRNTWKEHYLANGFSQQAATSYANMTAIFTKQHYDQPQQPHKGPTGLAAYLASAVAERPLLGLPR